MPRRHAGHPGAPGWHRFPVHLLLGWRGLRQGEAERSKGFGLRGWFASPGLNGAIWFLNCVCFLELRAISDLAGSLLMGDSTTGRGSSCCGPSSAAFRMGCKGSVSAGSVPQEQGEAALKDLCLVVWFALGQRW